MSLAIDNALYLARTYAAQDPPKKSGKGVDYTVKPPREFTYTPASEYLRVGRDVLPKAGLFLRAVGAHVSPEGLTRTYRLSHPASFSFDEWTTTTPMSRNAPPDLAAVWARTHSLVGVLKDLLWPDEEDVPDPSDRPARKVEESRTQAQVQEEARRKGNGARLPDRNGASVVLKDHNPPGWKPHKGKPHLVPPDASVEEHLGLKPGDGLPVTSARPMAMLDTTCDPPEWDGWEQATCFEGTAYTGDESSAPPAASSSTVDPEEPAAPSGSAGLLAAAAWGAAHRWPEDSSLEPDDSPPATLEDAEEESNAALPPWTPHVSQDEHETEPLDEPTAEQVNVVANVVEGSLKLAANSAALVACAGPLCEAGKADGIACPPDECDRESGVRPANSLVNVPLPVLVARAERLARKKSRKAREAKGDCGLCGRPVLAGAQWKGDANEQVHTGCIDVVLGGRDPRREGL